jgi:hypothetical protein
MNNTGFQIRNYYFSAALYMKLIVNNVKYRGIQCDFGRLTDVFFVTPDSLLIAVQRDTDFFQYTYYFRVFKPAQKGVLNKAGFSMHKCNMPRVKNELQVENYANVQHSSVNLNPESGAEYFRGRSLHENSTVIHYKNLPQLEQSILRKAVFAYFQQLGPVWLYVFLTISLTNERDF